MPDIFFKILERWGTIAGWITAIIQIPIWLVGFYLRGRKKQKLLQDLIEKERFSRDEYYKMKDRANGWFHITMQVLVMMKFNAPKIYKDFTDSYGGEDKFKDWWILPEIPKED